MKKSVKKFPAIKKILFKLSTALPAIALIAALASSEAACWFFYHQPDVPDSLKKFDN